jgi:triacylglycerol lipase
MPKPMPELTVAAAVPPNRERVYFEECARIPFAAHATKCHLPNAWWLAEAAYAAYEKFPAPERPIDLSPVMAAGFDIRPTTVGSTQFITLESSDALIVAFRGTRLDDIVLPFTKGRAAAPNQADVATDLRLLPRMIAPEVFVHRGFHDAYSAIEGKLDAVVAGASHESKPIWLCGHSLGGALATLAAYQHRGKIHGLYTFGSPRVGNGGFAKALADSLANIWRFVHHRDAVATVPPEGPAGPKRYAHVGQLKFISGKGTWRIEDGGSALNTVSALATDAIAHAKEVGRTLMNRFSLTDPLSWPITIEAIADHSPMYYTNKIFNAHEDRLGHGA